MRIIRKLFTAILFILFGYWLALSNVLAGSKIEHGIQQVMDVLPITSDTWDQPAHTKTNIQTTLINTLSDSSKENFDFYTIQQDIIKKTNELRAELGAGELTEQASLDTGALIRAQETMTSFSHTRPNGQSPFSVFTDSAEAPNYNYTVIGENLGMATHHRLNQAEVTDLIFNGWVDSPGHYENMINPSFTEIGVGVASDGEAIYITQLFGRPQ